MDMWPNYVTRLRKEAGHETQEQSVEATGVPQATISRWIRGQNGRRDPALVAKFAKGYDRNVLEAFVAAGLLALEDARAGLDPESVAYLKSVARPVRKLRTGPVKSKGQITQ